MTAAREWNTIIYPPEGSVFSDSLSMSLSFTSLVDRADQPRVAHRAAAAIIRKRGRKV